MLAVPRDKANCFHFFVDGFDDRAGHVLFGNVALRARVQMLLTRAGCDNRVSHARRAEFIGQAPVLIRINRAIAKARIEPLVLRHQFVELRIRRLVEANDFDVLSQAADNLAGLIGKRVQLFGCQIESLGMPEADPVCNA